MRVLRHISLFLFGLVAACLNLYAAGEDTPNTYGNMFNILANKQWKNGVYEHTYLEYSYNTSANAFAYSVVKQAVGYRFNNHVKADASAYWIKYPAKTVFRYEVNFSAFTRVEDWTFSYSQRFAVNHNAATGENTPFTRSITLVKYHIPGTRFTPLICSEYYYGKHWMTTRYYGGVSMSLSKDSAIDLRWYNIMSASKSYQNNYLSVYYTVNL